MVGRGSGNCGISATPLSSRHWRGRGGRPGPCPGALWAMGPGPMGPPWGHRPPVPAPWAGGAPPLWAGGPRSRPATGPPRAERPWGRGVVGVRGPRRPTGPARALNANGPHGATMGAGGPGPWPRNEKAPRGHAAGGLRGHRARYASGGPDHSARAPHAPIRTWRTMPR